MDALSGSTKAGQLFHRVRGAVPSLGLSWGGETVSDWPAELALLSDEALLGSRVVDPAMASLVRCGLLVRADLFDAPHVICQEVPTTTGSYWHGIVHRREPDFGNSRYWFRRVGEHPVHRGLHKEVAALVERHGSEWRGEAVQEILARPSWDPFLFIDLFESCHGGRRPGLIRELEALQELEIHLLLRHSYLAAVGDSPRA